MKKRKVVYRFDEFVDFAGRTRKFVVAALSELLPNAAEVTTPREKYETPIEFNVVEMCGDGHVHARYRPEACVIGICCLQP